MLLHGKFNFLTLTSLRIIIQRIMEIGGGEVGGSIPQNLMLLLASAQVKN